MGFYASREIAAELIRRAWEEAAGRVLTPTVEHGDPILIGLFIQELNLGWRVEIRDGHLMVSEGFPREAGNRILFKTGGDFHRFATGTPGFWLVFRRRARYEGSHRAIRLIRRPLVRAYSHLWHRRESSGETSRNG